MPADSTDLDDDGDTTEQTPLDLDSNPRFAETPGVGCEGTAVVDLGAYESAGQPAGCLKVGDINANGTVNVLDLIALLLSFGLSCAPGCCVADLNFDGVVNVLDLIELLLAFGTSCT